MDKRSIDEFESVFEAAVRPRVDIEPVTWGRLLVGLDGTERAASAVGAALHLAKRVGVSVRFVATRALLEGEAPESLQAALNAWQEEALARATDAGVEASSLARVGTPGEILVEELRSQPTSLAFLSTPHGGQTPDQASLGSTVDYVLKESDCPALLVKAALEDPAQVFQRILAYIPGGFEVGPHFSVPFALVESAGSLELMHVVDEAQVHTYAAAFEITPDADTEQGKAESIIRGLEARMTQLLEAAVREVRERPFACRSLVGEGKPVERVALRLLNQRNTLLVVESELRPQTAIPAEAYAVIKEITGVPILAL